MTHETDKRISFEIDFNELFITLIPQLLLFYVSSVYKKRIPRISGLCFIQYSKGSLCLWTKLVTILLHCHSANIYHFKLVLMQHYPISISSTKQLSNYVDVLFRDVFVLFNLKALNSVQKLVLNVFYIRNSEHTLGRQSLI